MLRRIAVIVASLSSAAAAAMPALAFDGSEGVVAKVYVSIPLGGGGGEEFAPSFGFAVEALGAFRESSRSFDSPNPRARIADVRFTAQGLSALEFGGLDALDYDLRLNAAGEDEGGDSINWLYVLYGAGGAGLLAAVLLADIDAGGGGAICSRIGNFGRRCTKNKCIKLGGTWAGGICLKP